MSLPVQTRVALGVLAIFLAGGVAGAFIGARFQMEAQTKRADMTYLSENVMDLLDQRLGLDDQQSEDIEPLVAEACVGLGRVFRENHDRVSDIMTLYYKRMAEHLTEEQKKTLVEMESVLRAKAEELKQQLP